MATKKRKADAECRSSQDKWTSEFFFVELKGKHVCLVWPQTLSVITAWNVQNRMRWKDQSARGQGQAALRQRLSGQQADSSKPRADQGPVSESRFSENHDLVNHEMRETLFFCGSFLYNIGDAEHVFKATVCQAVRNVTVVWLTNARTHTHTHTHTYTPILWAWLSNVSWVYTEW